MDIRVHFDTTEVEDVLKKEYVRLVGSPPDGYELHVSSIGYGGSDVSTIKVREDVPAETDPETID